jgi:DNA-binding transcriptional MerR regulator
MTISELADALGVRPSTLRFWEQEGLVRPERVTRLGARRYHPPAIREARITAALRAAGYRVPAVRDTLDAIRGYEQLDEPLDALQHRLTSIAHRTIALLDAGTHIARLLSTADVSHS